MDNETNSNSAPNNQEPVNPSIGSDDLIKNIVLSDSLNQENMLEVAPQLDKSLLKEVKYEGSALLVMIKLLFIILAIGSLASFMFFTLRLTNNLEFINKKINVTNVIQELSDTNREIISRQTDLNFYRYLQAQVFLTNFTYYGDTYIKYSNIANSLTASSFDKQEAVKKMAYYRPRLEETFIKAKEQLAKPFAVNLAGEEYIDLQKRDAKFKEELISKLKAKTVELEKETSDEGKSSYKNYLQTIALVQNDKLKTRITSTDVKALDDDKLTVFIKELNGLLINDLTIIQNIKLNRIRWSDVIKEIESRTIAVDKYYNNNSFDTYGGIRYTNYDFDSKTKKITISGDTKRFDTTNFTVIANLIDELNRSPIFKDTEMRSFSKSGSIEDGFTAMLRLSMTLDTENLGKAVLDKKTDAVSPLLNLTKPQAQPVKVSEPPALPDTENEVDTEDNSNNEPDSEPAPIPVDEI